MIPSNINMTIEQDKAPSLEQKTNTDYWSLLPNEIFEKIIFQLDARTIALLREVCSRNICIIDNSKYLTAVIGMKKAEKLFAVAHKHMPSIESINKSFIEYIKKNNYVDRVELNNIKLLITKYNYHAVQFLLAKMIEDSICSLKQIYFLDKSYFNTPELAYVLRNSRLLFTDNSNTFLYNINQTLYELQIINNKLEVTKTIKSIKYFGACIRVCQIYKNYIILSRSHGCAGNHVIFLKKINESYKDITPKELCKPRCEFIKVQTDTKGNTIFCFWTSESYLFYNMNDSSECINSIDSGNIKITKFSYKLNIRIFSVITSKYNDLMIIYGENLISEKIEAQIYKDNVKIDTIIFKTPFFTTANYDCICSPQADGFIIRDVDTVNSLVIYKISYNKIEQISFIKTHEDMTIYNQNPTNIIYGDNGKCIFFKNDINLMFYINLNNQVQTINVDDAQKYIFNESGYMLLGINENEIQVHNFQKAEKGIVETAKISCKYKIVTAKFSPNSQLVALTEQLPSSDGLDVIRLRLYKIMSIDADDNIQIIPKPNYIAEYYTNVSMKFKFHPDGTKIVIDEYHKISILEISKADTD